MRISALFVFLPTLICCFMMGSNQCAAQQYDEIIASNSVMRNDGSKNVKRSDLPKVYDDNAIVLLNNTVIFDPLENDVINGDVMELSVIESPKYGTVTIDKFDSFVYKPAKELCEVTDEFTYLVANESGESVGKIIINVICEEITIFSGFSPNDDDVNDYFTIIGIERFPNNTLSVFNQWGEEVFTAENYQNDWSGEVNGIKLEKDIYYYVFDDGKNNVYSGSLQLN